MVVSPCLVPLSQLTTNLFSASPQDCCYFCSEGSNSPSPGGAPPASTRAINVRHAGIVASSTADVSGFTSTATAAAATATPDDSDSTSSSSAVNGEVYMVVSLCLIPLSQLTANLFSASPQDCCCFCCEGSNSPSPGGAPPASTRAINVRHAGVVASSTAGVSVDSTATAAAATATPDDSDSTSSSSAVNGEAGDDQGPGDDDHGDDIEDTRGDEIYQNRHSDIHRRRKEKGKEAVAAAPQIAVRARLSDSSRDVIIHIGRDETVRGLARRISEKAKLPPNIRIRIAYLGKILKNGATLAAQGWKEGHVVNALEFDTSLRDR